MLKRPNRNRVGQTLALALAAAVVAAACASDPNDGVAEAPAETTTSSTTTSAPDAGSEPDESGTGGSSTGGSSTAGSGTATDDGNGEVEGSATAGTDDGDRSGEDSTTSGSAATATAAALRSLGECGAVLEYIRSNAAAAVGPWGITSDGFGRFDGDMGDGAVAMLAETDASGGFGELQAGVDFSTSNVQETGIDEPAALKTDGRRLVAAVQNRVQIVDVTGPTPSLTASIEFEDVWGHRLLLHGDRLLVMSTRWGSVGPHLARDEPISPDLDWGPTAEIAEIDLSSASPAVVRRLSIEGDLVSARMTDGVVRLVTSSRPRAIPWAVPERAGSALAEERAVELNREIVADSTVEDWLPHYELSDASGATLTQGRLVDCDSVWAPVKYSGPGALSVTTIDISSGGLDGPRDTSTIMSDGSTVYASPDHLYVTTTEWADWFTRSTSPADDGSVAQTEIHMFDTTERLTSPYVGSASVTGTVLNQYSMSEHEGHLRIATTTVPRWSFEGDPDSESLVTVLAADSDGLSVVGQVDGLGVGERIFAVRYLGDIAAVVTFRQVDPLYLIDLAEPTAPQVRGELKITGFSSYLHPIDDDLLLGIGQEATEEGFVVGSQASLFDISDLASPQRIAQWTAPGASSPVEFDPLAFLYWHPLDMAVVPMNQYPEGSVEAGPSFLGAVVLSTSDRGLAELARFSHAAVPVRKCHESQEITILPDGSEERSPLSRYCWFESDYAARVMASAVVEGSLYLMSDAALEEISLDSLERVSLLHWAF